MHTLLARYVHFNMIVFEIHTWSESLQLIVLTSLFIWMYYMHYYSKHKLFHWNIDLIYLEEISSNQWYIKSENAINRSVTKPVTVNPNVHQSSNLLSDYEDLCSCSWPLLLSCLVKFTVTFLQRCLYEIFHKYTLHFWLKFLYHFIWYFFTASK